MNKIVIDYPDFPEEIQISAKRRAKHFREEDLSVLPKKYLYPSPATGGLRPEFVWKQHKSEKLLWDTRTQTLVVKNPLSASKPRFITIAGNDIMRMHEGVWQKIVDTLKEFFMSKLGTYSHTEESLTNHGKVRKIRKYMPNFLLTGFPLSVRMEIHTFPRYANWDLSNLWVYNKAFEDAAQEAGVLPNDNIRNITLPGAPKFIPVIREEDRMLRFIIEPETDPRILNHLLYWSAKSGPFEEPFTSSAFMPVPFEYIRVQITTSGKPGDLFIETKNDNTQETPIRTVIMNINLGRENRHPEKGLLRLRHQCFQLNMIPEFHYSVWDSVHMKLIEIFLNQGIPIFLRE